MLAVSDIGFRLRLRPAGTTLCHVGEACIAHGYRASNSWARVRCTTKLKNETQVTVTTNSSR